jgi:hypothetical protein
MLVSVVQVRAFVKPLAKLTTETPRTQSKGRGKQNEISEGMVNREPVFLN